jgi:hypothetical protein
MHFVVIFAAVVAVALLSSASGRKLIGAEQEEE